MSDTECVIQVRNLKKSFKVYYDRGFNLKDRILFWNRNKYGWRNVLDGISFDIKRGEAVGIIGHNGCGKSTLLKLLTRIMYPTEGSITMTGRIACLIELGAGFHPDMSGRENIYINASIFGLTRKEIDGRIDSIIEFSELGQYIENPVRTYSSGMYMRLAFSIAISVSADILLVDEILAVGDAQFQAKCFNKMRQIKAEGTTIVIVSHALGQIEQLCDRTIWVHDGKIHAEGSPFEVHPKYLKYMQKKNEAESGDFRSSVTLVDDDDIVKIKEVSIEDSEGNALSNIEQGTPVNVVIEYESDISRADEAAVGVLIMRNDGVVAYGSNTFIEHLPFIQLKEKGRVTCCIEKLNLMQGEYRIDVTIHKSDMLPYAFLGKAVVFKVYSTTEEIGICHLDHTWEFS